MTDRAGFFAGLADILTAMCVYYVVGGLLVAGARWGVHPGWLLLCAGVSAAVFSGLLRRPRGVPLLTAVTGLLFAVSLGLFLLVSRTPAGVGYVFVLAVGAGIAAGLPLYTCLHRPAVLRHLTHLDTQIAALLAVLLTREALGIDGGAVALMTAVLFLDAAAAVGLRMSDGDGGEDGSALRASLVALAAAVVLALIIGLFVALFSRSGAVTGAVLRSVGAFFAALGGRIEGIFRWLSALLYREERFDAIPLEGEMPSLAGMEQAGGDMALPVDPAWVGAVLCVLLLAAAVAAAVLLRKKRLVMGTKTVSAASHTVVRRSGGALGIWLSRLRAALAFRWTAFRRRNTAAGLLVQLERLARRAGVPRQTGESMRGFIRRMDPGGGLCELADALDTEYYGGGGSALGAKRCRELRRAMHRIRKAVRHG